MSDEQRRHQQRGVGMGKLTQQFISALESLVHHIKSFFALSISFAIQDCLDLRHLKHLLVNGLFEVQHSL